MDIEPLPKVTFLPAQLTELVIKDWTGETVDYEKNGQVSTSCYDSNFIYRFAKSTMDKVHANLEMDIPTRENSSTVFYTEKDNSAGLTERSTKESLTAMKLPGTASTNGQTVQLMMDKLEMGSDMDKENILMNKKVLNIKANGLMV